MKRILILFLPMFFLCSMAWSQTVPQGMKYQAVARDLKGSILANQPIELKIALISDVARQSIAYSETHSVTTNEVGLFTLVIGEGENQKGLFEDVPWSTHDIWMEVSIKDKDATDFALISNSRLLAVPYAFHAGTANEIVGPIGRSTGGGVPANVWTLFGNSNIDDTKDHLGTTDCADLVMITNNIERLRITCEGDINIMNDLDIGADLDIGHDLHVGNDATIDQDVFLNVDGGNTTVNGDLTVANMSSTHLTGMLTVDGTTTLNDDLTVTGMNPTILTGTLVVDRATDLNDNLNVDGTTTLNDDLTVTNMATTLLTGTLTVDKATDLNDNLNVDGTTTLNDDLTVTDMAPTLLTGTLTVDKATDLNDNLNVDGTTTLNDDLTVTDMAPTLLTGTLTVDKATDLNDNLNVDGTTTLHDDLTVTDMAPTLLTGTLTVDKATDLNDNLNVDGTTTLHDDLTVTDMAPTLLTGTLTVDKATDLNNNLNVDGTTTLHDDLTVTDMAPTLLTGTLTVDKATDLNNNLNVDGTTTLHDDLTVDNMAPTLLTGNLTVDQDVTIGGTFTTTGVFNINNTLNVTGGDTYAAKFINTNNTNSNGICIQVDAAIPSTANDFITFKNKNGGTVGRIEGQTLDELHVSFQYVFYETMQALNVACGAAMAIADIADADPFAAIVDVAQFIILGVEWIGYTIDLGNRVGVAYESGNGDYAEWLEKGVPNEVFSYGDIVGVKGGKISKEMFDADQYMVVSLSPIILGNMPPLEKTEFYEKVAFMGQVPVKVRGVVNIGDYIIVSDLWDGFGRAVSPLEITVDQFQKIVGVAWSAADGKKAYSMINVAVGINTKHSNDKLKQLQGEVDELKLGFNSVTSYLQAKDPGFNAELFAVSPEKVNENEFASQDTKEGFTSNSNNNNLALVVNYLEKNPEMLKKVLANAKEILDSKGIDYNRFEQTRRLVNDEKYFINFLKESSQN